MTTNSTTGIELLAMEYPRVHDIVKRGQEGIQQGTLPAKVFNDPQVYEVERERVFGKAWIYLGHVTELPNNNDYMLRNIADNPLIVTRGADGEIRAVLNACAHRGVQLARADKGNAKLFRCPYHGWTYRNCGKLAGIPQKKEAYGDAINEADWSLKKVPRLEIFQGMIFGNLDPDAISLDEYLGDMKWYLELLTNRTEGGLQVVGEPQRWIVNADWKMPADNFIGDSYHTQTAHQSIVEMGLLPDNPFYAMAGDMIDAGNGHGLGLTGAPPGIPLPPYFGLPEEIVASAKQRLSPEQLQVMEKSNFCHSTVFPNLSFLHIMTAKDAQSELTPMITFRQWQPAGFGKIEIWSWCLVDTEAPEAFKEESYKTYLRTFGISGTFEQDDAEVWQTSFSMTKGEMARDMNFNYQMGHTTLEPREDWPGPGKAYPLGYAEFPQRGWHSRWLQYMSGEV